MSHVSQSFATRHRLERGATEADRTDGRRMTMSEQRRRSAGVTAPMTSGAGGSADTLARPEAAQDGCCASTAGWPPLTRIFQ